MRLRTRLIALVCLAALPPIGIQAWTDVQLANEQRARLEAQLLAEARLIAGEQVAMLESGRQLLTALAASPAVRIPNAEGCTQYLTNLATGFAAFRVLAVADRAGRITCASRPLPFPPPSVADRAWFRRTMQVNEPTMGEPAAGAISAEVQLPFAFPLRGPDGKPFGVVVAGLDLSGLAQRLAAQASPDRAVIVTDAESRLVVATVGTPGLAAGQRAPDLPGLSNPAGNEVVVRTQDGTQFAATSTARGSLGRLRVTVVAPAETVLAPIRRSAARAQLLLGGVALLALVVAVIGARLFLERPLARLTQAAGAWRGGEYSRRVALPGSGELADLGGNFDAMAEAVESRDAALKRAAENKARLLAAAAHDQRHRLQVLQLLVDRAGSATPDPEYDRRIAVAADASLRDLERSISQLLSASALESGAGPKPQPRAVPARLLLDQAAASVRLKAESKGLRVRVVTTRHVVITDPGMMSTVLLNLAENAVKYSDRGGIVIGLRRGPGRALRIAVYDTGIGIPAADRSRIFEEFNRLNPTREGLGLGLSIVRRLCGRLGHEVTVASTEGRGSAFFVQVPAG